MVLLKKWKNLRDNYFREYKRLKNMKSGSSGTRKTIYVFYKQLSFLKPATNPTAKNTNIDPTEGSDSSRNIEVLERRQLRRKRRRRIDDTMGMEMHSSFPTPSAPETLTHLPSPPPYLEASTLLPPAEDVPDDIYNLHWEDFSQRLWGNFSLLLESKDLVDVTIAADGKYIQAHKLVLSACSEYFRDLFKINPCQHPIVLLKDVDYESLNAVIQFMYCGEVQVTGESLGNFLQIAEILKVKGINSDQNDVPLENKKTLDIPVSDAPNTPNIREANPILPFIQDTTSFQPTPPRAPTSSKKRKTQIPTLPKNIKVKLNKPTEDISNNLSIPFVKKQKISKPSTSKTLDRPSTSSESFLGQEQIEVNIETWNVDVADLQDDNIGNRKKIKIEVDDEHTINVDPDYDPFGVKKEGDFQDYMQAFEMGDPNNVENVPESDNNT